MESKIYLDENVQVQQQNFLIKSQKATVNLDHYGNKRPKYFTFENQVFLNQTLPNQVERNGFREKLEGFLPENYMIMTGAPRVEQGKDVTINNNNKNNNKNKTNTNKNKKTNNENKNKNTKQQTTNNSKSNTSNLTNQPTRKQIKHKHTT